MEMDPLARLSKLNRRQFIRRSGRNVGVVWLSANFPLVLSTANLACQAKSQNADFLVLSEHEAALTDALASMIIPTDDTPGAHEAGVVYFIDQALTSFAVGQLDLIRDGLAAVKESVAAIHSSGEFGRLSDSEKAAIMDSIALTAFFGQFYFLTMAGMLSHPSHGGNRDKIGWKMIGFDDRHVWQYPFGYYDANESTLEDK